jgi:hypothetical protein
VVAYDNFDSGIRAKEILDRLARALGSQLPMNLSMWKFEMLELDKLQDMAASDAAAADIIIISTGGAGELSPGVQQWVERWLSRKQRESSAFVSLNEADPDGTAESPAVSEYLQTVASRGNVIFFSQRGNLPVPDFQSTVQAICREAEQILSATAAILQQPYAEARWMREQTSSATAAKLQRSSRSGGWGINE